MLAFLAAGLLRADESADRKAIDEAIERLNFSSERAGAFAAGTDVEAEMRRLETAGCTMVGSPKVWSEAPSPRFTRRALQFVVPDVAVADVELVHYTPGLPLAKPQHTPVVAILKRERGAWKIATLRVTAGCGGELRILPAAR